LDFDRFGKPEYGSKRIENIARDMDVSISDLYKCIQFARKYPNIVTPLQNLSWRTIVNKYLPESIKYQNSPNIEPLSNKKYNIIYADPPWNYETILERNGMHGKVNGIAYYYGLMNIEDIKEITILAGDDSWLFLWTTATKLLDGIEVVKSWDYEYKTCAIWDKWELGLGWFFRIQHEILLIGKRGDPPKPKNVVRSIFEEKRTTHSKKPNCVRKWIEESFPDCPKIELFARQRHKGWDTWGIEVAVA